MKERLPFCCLNAVCRETLITYEETNMKNIRCRFGGVCRKRPHLGIRLSMNDPDRLDQAKWKGQNLLGYALMMAWDRL